MRRTLLRGMRNEPSGSFQRPEHQPRRGALRGPSGLQAHQHDQSARAVTDNPGMTSNELAQATGLDRYMLARRLPELIKAGRVWRGPNKPCAVSGRTACTWWPVAPGQNLALGI